MRKIRSLKWMRNDQLKRKQKAMKEYNELKAYFSEQGDRGFCVPLALTILTGLPPEVVSEALERHGRKKGEGTSGITKKRALFDLGFELVHVDPRSIINNYPGVHRKLRHVTSKHMTRFPEAFRGRSLYFSNGSHAWTCLDGEPQDWSHNRSLRATWIFRLIPKCPLNTSFYVWHEYQLKENRLFNWETQSWL